MRLPPAVQHPLPRHHLDERSDQRVGAFVHVPALLRQLGADADAVLASAGLATAALTHAEQRIPYGALGALLERSAQASDYPQFGLLAGRMFQLEDLGLVGEVVRNSATVGEALQVMTVYQHLNSCGGLAFVVRRAAIVDFGYAIYHAGIDGADQLYDCALATGVNLMRELCGPGWAPTEVFLPHVKGCDPHLYRSVFKVLPRFDSEFCALRFPAYWLERRVDGADPDRRRAALLRAHEASQPQLLHQVCRALRTLLLNGKSSGDDLAQLLAMHRRTLNRRLREHGTTFQEVLDEVRFEAARQLLSYSELPLDDIAASLGYAGVSTFMRSFRRWTGNTPGQWRRQAQRERVASTSDATDRFRTAVPTAVPLVAPQGLWNASDRARDPKHAPPWARVRNAHAPGAPLAGAAPSSLHQRATADASAPRRRA